MVTRYEFEKMFISSTEICKRLLINRSALAYARKAQNWPEPIIIDGINLHLWDREQVTPLIEEWEAKLNRRRGA